MSAPIVVVADDSRTIRLMVTRALEEGGYQVREAATGVEALAQISEERPFLAIVDINMPEMNGYELCEKLKQMGRPWDQMPILFLTSQNSHALEVLGRELGAYLRKPVSSEMVLNTVNSLVSTHLSS